MSIRSLSSVLKRSALAGFSLAETALALGVLAFCLTALLGMIPTSLNTMRNSMDTAISTQIIQRVVNDIRMADWGQITGGNQPTSAITRTMNLRNSLNGTQQTIRFFDAQGNELPSSRAAEALYRVQAVVNFPAIYAGANTYQAARITVQCSNNPPIVTGQTVNRLWVEQPGEKIITYSFLTARTQP